MRHQFGGGGLAAVFVLLNEFAAFVVMIGGEFVVEAALGNEAVEVVVGEAVAGAVFVGEADKPSGRVVVVGEGVA